MLFEFIEKLRKEPLSVRRQVVFLVTIILVMLVTVIWAIATILSF